MIDEGEDWKVVTIDAADKWAPSSTTLTMSRNNVTRNAHCIREGQYRKIPDGKPPNVFGLDERFMTRYAVEVIHEAAHEKRTDNVSWLR
jgi:inorganic pyrophosphatase